MTFKKLIVIIIFFILAGAISCSQHATIPSQVSYQPSFPLQGIDSLVKVPEVDFAFYHAKPAQFYEPKLEISEHFNMYEQSIVGVPDEALFAKRSELIIEFDQLASKGFYFPLPGARILSPYGKRHGRMHTGFDLKISTHDTVFAAFDGIVRMANLGRGYGNVIVIRHYNGLETVYAHNSKHLVQSGDHVNAGDPISITGDTGRATTDHLHFEVRINGKPFDPDLIINFNTQSLRHKSLVFTPDTEGKIQIEQV